MKNEANFHSFRHTWFFNVNSFGRSAFSSSTDQHIYFWERMQLADPISIFSNFTLALKVTIKEVFKHFSVIPLSESNTTAFDPEFDREGPILKIEAIAMYVLWERLTPSDAPDAEYSSGNCKFLCENRNDLNDNSICLVTRSYMSILHSHQNSSI